MRTLLLMVYGLFRPCCFTHVTGTCFKETTLCPTDKYMFKVNNKKIRLICMCSNLKINTAWHRSFVFIVNFDHSQHINIVFLLLTLNKYLSVRCEGQVIMFWKPYFKIETNYNHIKCLLWNEHIMDICFSSKFALAIPRE